MRTSYHTLHSTSSEAPGKPTMIVRRKKRRKGIKRLLLRLCIAALVFAGGFSAGHTYLAASDASASYTGEHLAGNHEESLPAPYSSPEESEFLTLVRADFPLPSGFAPESLAAVEGYEVDSRIAEDLTAMLRAARAEGLSPIICSGYRSTEKQTTLFQSKVNTLRAQGYSQADAEQEAATAVAKPGTSEHNLGLAVDIVAQSYQLLDDKQAQTPEAIWLAAHCHEYGFILRYPESKSDITGIIYEPWHFRYVGYEAAAAIMRSGLTLEEYLG